MYKFQVPGVCKSKGRDETIQDTNAEKTGSRCRSVHKEELSDAPTLGLCCGIRA